MLYSIVVLVSRRYSCLLYEILNCIDQCKYFTMLRLVLCCSNLQVCLSTCCLLPCDRSHTNEVESLWCVDGCNLKQD